jgi:ParB family chromosome partitioning protein
MPRKSDKVEMWSIRKLKRHPQQDSLFDDLPEAQFQAFVESMRPGQDVPIEILPDGTIITGHQRVRAARALGWREIKVIVRHDLAQQGEDAVLARLIGDNLNRRHLSPLARARSICRLCEVLKRQADDDSGRFSEAAVRRKIAEQLGVSDKTVLRYLNVVRTPMEVQQAFDRGDLSLVVAGRVALLPGFDQDKLAERIRRGEAAKDVVKKYLTGLDAANVSAEDILKLAAKQLNRMCYKLQDRIEEIRPRLIRAEHNALLLGRGLIDRLLERAEEQVEEYADETEESNGPTDGDGEEE